MSEMPKIAALVQELLQHHGAVLKARPDSPLFDVELGSKLSAFLKAPSLTLCFDAEQSVEGLDEQAELVVTSGRVHDQLSAFLRDLGGALWCILKPTHEAASVFPEGFGVEAARPPQAHMGTAFDLEVCAKISFLTESREEHLFLAMGGHDQKVQAQETSVLQSLKGSVDPVDILNTSGLPSQQDLQERLGKIFVELERWTLEKAQEKERELLERLSGEVYRLSNYYAELIAQNEKDSELQAQLSKDLSRRLEEELDTHRLHIEIDLLTFAIMLRPQSVWALEVTVDGKLQTQRWRQDLSNGQWYDPSHTLREP